MFTSCRTKMVPWPTSNNVCSTLTSPVCCDDWPCFSISINIVSASAWPSSISTDPCNDNSSRTAAVVCARPSNFWPTKYFGNRARQQELAQIYGQGAVDYTLTYTLILWYIKDVPWTLLFHYNSRISWWILHFCTSGNRNKYSA